MSSGRNGKNGNGNGVQKCPFDGLSTKQDRAAYLLAGCEGSKTDAEISQDDQVRVSTRQLTRWKNLPAFNEKWQAYWQQSRPAIIPRTYRKLEAFADNPTVPTSVRVQALNCILQHERNAGNVNVSTSVTVHTPAQELREKPRTELGEILERELSTLNRLSEKVLVGSDPKPGNN